MSKSKTVLEMTAAGLDALLRDDDATDAQKLQWRRDLAKLSPLSSYAVLEVIEISRAYFVHPVLQYSPHILVNWI